MLALAMVAREAAEREVTGEAYAVTSPAEWSLRMVDAIALRCTKRGTSA